MAIYHLETKPIKRSEGRSSVASAAYRTGVELEDLRTGLIHDYSKKQGIVKTDCFVFDGDEKIKLDRQDVWGKAELAEKRKDGRTAREFIVNLPHELTDWQRIKLVEDFSETIAKRYGVALDFAIHRPNKNGDQRNHHAHILVTTRTAKMENGELVLTDKTMLEQENGKLKKLGLPLTQEQITSIRESFANITNNHLRMAGIDETIDHRSYEEQGINQVPTIKMGWKATQLEREGQHTHAGNINREIQSDNIKIEMLENEIFSLQMDLLTEQLATAPTFNVPKPKPAARPQPAQEDSLAPLLTLAAVPQAANVEYVPEIAPPPPIPEYRTIADPSDIRKNAPFIAHVIANYAQYDIDHDFRGHYYDFLQMPKMRKLFNTLQHEIKLKTGEMQTGQRLENSIQSLMSDSFINKYKDMLLFAESPHIEREQRLSRLRIDNVKYDNLISNVTDDKKAFFNRVIQDPSNFEKVWERRNNGYYLDKSQVKLLEDYFKTLPNSAYEKIKQGKGFDVLRNDENCKKMLALVIDPRSYKDDDDIDTKAALQSIPPRQIPQTTPKQAYKPRF